MAPVAPQDVLVDLLVDLIGRAGDGEYALPLSLSSKSCSLSTDV